MDRYHQRKRRENRKLGLPPRSPAIFDTWVTKVADLGLAKKFFAEPSESTAGAAQKATTRRVYSKVSAKRRQAIAKKYKLDLQTLDSIEQTGRTNLW
jgi:hypothetical protein